MPRIVFFTGLLGLFLMGTAPVSSYAADSAYDIKNVQVDILDESAVKARNKAFTEAQKKAFLMLAARFEAPEALPALKPPADDILSGLIQDFEISSEQLSTKRYRGVFEFRFKSAAVNRYFGHGPTNYAGVSEPEANKILIVPYCQEGKNPPAFNKVHNPFMVSLQAELPADGAILLPEGSISDLTDIGEADPHILSEGTIRRLKARYEVRDVMIALAHVDVNNPQSVKIEIFKTDTGRVELVKTLDVTPKQAASATFQAITTTPEVIVPTEAQPENVPQSVINPEHFALKARGMMTPELAEKKTRERERQASAFGKGYTQPEDDSSVGEASVKVFFTNMAEWLAIQRQLTTVDGARSLRIVSLKTNQVDIIIGYSDWPRFAASLQTMGLSLEPQADRTYILKRQAGHF